MAQIIVINSVNSASGKSLLAAHLSIMLAKDYRTVVMDSDGETSALALFIAKRHALNLKHNYNLGIPEYASLNQENFSQRQKSADVIILDSPDDKYFKYADIFITPIKGDVGLQSVIEKSSLYASLLWQAKKNRAADGKNAFRWVVIPNDTLTMTDFEKLRQTGKFLGYSVAPQLKIRKEYADGLSQGLTVCDKDLPVLKSLFGLSDLYARRELKKLSEFIWQNK